MAPEKATDHHRSGDERAAGAEAGSYRSFWLRPPGLFIISIGVTAILLAVLATMLIRSPLRGPGAQAAEFQRFVDGLYPDTPSTQAGAAAELPRVASDIELLTIDPQRHADLFDAVGVPVDDSELGRGVVTVAEALGGFDLDPAAPRLAALVAQREGLLGDARDAARRLVPAPTISVADDDLLINAITYDYGGLRRVAQLLAADLELALAEADERRASELVAEFDSLAGFLEPGAFLIESLVRMAIESLSLAAFLEIPLDTPLTDEQLARLADTLDRHRPAPVADLATAYEGERIVTQQFVDATFSELGYFKPAAAGEWGGGSPMPASTLGEVSAVAGPLFKDYDATSDLVDEIYRDFIRAVEITDTVERRRRVNIVASGVDRDLSWRDNVVLIVLPAFSSVVRTADRVHVLHHRALGRIALVRYHKRFGSAPDSVEDLVDAGLLGASRLDPDTEQPIALDRFAPDPDR